MKVLSPVTSSVTIPCLSGPLSNGLATKARAAATRIGRVALAAGIAVALAACQTGGTAAEVTPQPELRTQAPDLTFEAFLAGVRADAVAAGVSPGSVDRALAGLSVNEDVLARNNAQAEFTRAVWDYLDSAVSDRRVADGLAHLDRYRGEIDRAAANHGVAPEIITAIWGLESNYGSFQGTYSVLEALATLAYASDRSATFRPFLLDALKIVDAGDKQPDAMLGSWAGAMGQPQFMPTAYLQHAADGDGDGRRDIWSSPADVAASIGTYLAHFDWQPGLAWGLEVRLPAGFDYAQAELDIRRPVGDWAALGVTRVNGAPLVGDRLPAGAESSLLLRAGHTGPAFLVTGNFRTILRYNNSSSYALAVGLLSDRLAGRSGVVAAWPRQDRPLTGDENRELQERLSLRGYDPGPVDGMVGPMTRRAIRAFQTDLGVPADGYANERLLNALRG